MQPGWQRRLADCGSLGRRGGGAQVLASMRKTRGKGSAMGGMGSMGGMDLGSVDGMGGMG